MHESENDQIVLRQIWHILQVCDTKAMFGKEPETKILAVIEAPTRSFAVTPGLLQVAPLCGCLCSKNLLVGAYTRALFCSSSSSSRGPKHQKSHLLCRLQRLRPLLLVGLRCYC